MGLGDSGAFSTVPSLWPPPEPGVPPVLGERAQWGCLSRPPSPSYNFAV